MVSFGTKAGANVRRDIKNSTGGGSFLKTLQDGKDLRVRFLQNPEDWTTFREHYSQATKFFPCTQDDTCPGCNSDDERLQRASKRYAASVLDVSQGKVIPLKMPLDLANRVTNKCDRNGGTLLDRDFLLIRTGKSMDDTTYEVETEDKTSVDLSRYELLDIEKILQASFEETFGDPADTLVGAPKPVAQVEEELARLRALEAEIMARRAQEDKPPFDPKVVPGSTPMEQKKNLEENGLPAQPMTTTSSTQVTPEQTASTSDSPTSTEGSDSPLAPTTPGSGSDSTDEGYVSMDDLKAMDHNQLLTLCVDNKLKPPQEAVANAEGLLEWLLAEFGVE